MRIDGETRLMGVIGENIAYTRSPSLHNAAAAALGINAAYLPFSLPAAQVQPFLDVMWDAGALGFSITTPHKELAARLVPGAGLASVNTLYRGKTWWEGSSTDGEGFARGLQRIGRPLTEYERVVILGSGGATLALLTHLGATAERLPALTILRRGTSGAERDRILASAVKSAKGEAPAFADLSLETLTQALAGRGPETLLIQATSAPQRGDDLQALVPALAGYGGAVADLVYGKPSALYFAALAKDLTAQDGEPMLIEQARLAQQLWWGKAARYEALALALRGKA